MLVGGLVAFGVTFVACPIVLAALHRFRVIDDPNWRSSHSTSVPRGGGVALAVGTATALTLTPGLPIDLRLALLVLGLGVSAVGLADDLTRGTSPKLRLAAILAVTAISLLWMRPAVGLAAPVAVVVIGLCLGWVTSYVNAFNFMDGINGISAGQVLVVAGQVTVAALLAGERAIAIAAVIIVTSALAFVPFNFPRARMFLGDVGSYLLGALVAGLVIVAVVGGIALEAAASGVVLYAVDTFVTLVRRVRRGEVWHESHREHIYQRLTDVGLSHVAVTGIVTAMSGLCGALGILAAEWGDLMRLVTDGVIVLVAISYIALPTVLRRKRAAEASSHP